MVLAGSGEHRLVDAGQERALVRHGRHALNGDHYFRSVMIGSWESVSGPDQHFITDLYERDRTIWT